MWKLILRRDFPVLHWSVSRTMRFANLGNASFRVFEVPVMRHPDTRKWFAIIMDVPKDKLGLTGQQRVDVINVKLSDPLLVDVVTRQDGYFKGYHFNLPFHEK